MDCVLICKKGGLILPLTSGQGYDEKIDITAFLTRFQRAILWALGEKSSMQCLWRRSYKYEHRKFYIRKGRYGKLTKQGL